MSKNRYTRKFFRQARDFEKLETAFGLGKLTEEDQVMGQVCKGLADVCMMLAEACSKEDKKKEDEKRKN